MSFAARHTNDVMRDLNVTIQGAGLPLLMLHGGLGFDHTGFRPYLDPLSALGRLVYFDFRGNGHAVQPADWQQVTHASYVDDMESLRVALKADTMVLVGHSYGGFLALEYAARFPQHVAGLILCTTGPSYRHLDRVVENVRQRTTPADFDAIMRWLASPSLDDSSLARDIRPLLPAYLHSPTASLVHALFGRTQFRAAAFNHALSVLAPSYDVTDVLHTLDMPTLVIAGRDDPIFPLDCGPELLSSRMPRAQLVTIDACGHYPFAEHPERFLYEVREWLAENQLV